MEETDQCLPVAPLRDVLEQFREAMAPITSQEEFQKIEQDIESFFTGEGNFLQEKLKECSKQLRGTSWLREYSQQRFLSLRTPLTIVGNFTLEFWKNGEETSLLRNGTALAWSVGRLYQQLQAGEVPVPQGSSLSVRSEQMERVLGSARLPGHGTDTYAVYPADEVRAFGVFYRNRYYWVELFTADGKLAEPGQIYASLAEILGEKRPPERVNFHTAAYAGSEVYADFLEQFTQVRKNQENLQLVQRALFHLALKDTQREEIPFQNPLYSNTEDLWPYKPWSFTLYADGGCTVNNEHTAADGLTNVHLYRQVRSLMEQVRESSFEGGSGKFRELVFSMTPQQRSVSEKIRNTYEKQVAPFRVEEWSRSEIDWARWKALGVGRDALIQLWFLYASLDLYPTVRCIHESVSTAHFYQGRTSCLRPVTLEMLQAARVLKIQRAADGQALQLITAASQAHRRGIRRAKKNVCFVRHGAGLKQMEQRYGRGPQCGSGPGLLDSSAYQRFCSQEISTSTVGGEDVVKQFAFSPQVKGGLGIGYQPNPSGLRAAITWSQADLPGGELFGQKLQEYFDRLEAVLGTV